MDCEVKGCRAQATLTLATITSDVHLCVPHAPWLAQEPLPVIPGQRAPSDAPERL